MNDSGAVAFKTGLPFKGRHFVWVRVRQYEAKATMIGLHVNGHDYLLRATLTDFLEQLDQARFARVHRSYAVNLDRVAVIVPLEVLAWTAAPAALISISPPEFTAFTLPLTEPILIEPLEVFAVT